MFLRTLLLEHKRKNTLKRFRKHQIALTDDEKKICKERGAVWSDNDIAIWKSTDTEGKIWYISNTHRAWAKSPTIKGAIKKFDFIKTTS